jgi:hypothetical protein
VGILQTFADFIQTKYNAIPVDDESFERLAAIIHHTLPENANDVLDAPVTLDELHRAVKKGRPNKAPGAGGMSQDFFKDVWEVIHPDLLPILPTDAYRRGDNGYTKTWHDGMPSENTTS